MEEFMVDAAEIEAGIRVIPQHTSPFPDGCYLKFRPNTAGNTLVATDILSRGIDVDVEQVIMFELHGALRFGTGFCTQKCFWIPQLLGLKPAHV
jgi:hypothetical protein